MQDYQHVLLAVDFAKGAEAVGERAVELARRYGARLSLIHVVEYLPIALDNELLVPPLVEVESQLMDEARGRLERFAGRIGAAEAARHVELGSPKLEIVRIASERQADLIVLGSHGRHGLARVLGSTANAVLHVAPCDVLAVRVRE